MENSKISTIFSARMLNDENVMLKLRNGDVVFKHVNYLSKIALNANMSVGELCAPKTEVMYTTKPYSKGDDYLDADGSVAGQHTKDGVECVELTFSIGLAIKQPIGDEVPIIE